MYQGTSVEVRGLCVVVLFHLFGVSGDGTQGKCLCPPSCLPGDQRSQLTDSLSSFTLPGNRRALAISGNHTISRLEHANQLGISNATLILARARFWVPGGRCS